jgi:hypothetical protein
MGKSDLVQKVGGTNTLLVPGSQKLGGPVPPVPMVVAPMIDLQHSEVRDGG